MEMPDRAGLRELFFQELFVRRCHAPHSEMGAMCALRQPGRGDAEGPPMVVSFGAEKLHNYPAGPLLDRFLGRCRDICLDNSCRRPPPWAASPLRSMRAGMAI